jgi:hypothetical protein
METLKNIKLIANRISALGLPSAPLKGRGNIRHEVIWPNVFSILEKKVPLHCVVVTSRQKVNSFGKLGFVPHNYVSPELRDILIANAADFDRLETALNTVKEFSL